MNVQRLIRLLPAVALVAAACETPPVQNDPVSVGAFTSSAATVASGASVTLQWSVAGDLAALDVTRDGVVIVTSSDPSGEVVADALASGTTTFVLSARGRGGETVEARVEVRAVTAAAVDLFAADRSALPAGGAVTLSWRTVLADRVTISEGATQLAERTGAEALAGSLLVRPQGSTEYVLVAEGVGGRAEARVSVSMVDAPNIVSFAADPARVAPGATTTVTWATEGAEAVTLRADGRVVYDAPAAERAAGSRTLTIDRRTRLELSAARGGLVSTRTLTVEVDAPPRIVAFDAQPGFLALGGTTTLSWEVADADTVALYADDEEHVLDDPTAANGTLTVTPGGTRTYTLVATSAAGEAREAVVVDVYGVALVERFETDRTALFRGREPATLTWATTGGSELSITDTEGNVVDVSGRSVLNGSVEVRPERSTAYVLSLVGPAGIVTSAPVSISVSEPPPIVVLTLSKATMLDGETAELSWSVADHDSFTITANGAPVDLGGRGAEDSLVVRPEETTEYVLTATGPGGTEVGRATLAVVKPPAFTVFTSNRLDGDRVTVTRGGRHTVSWVTTDATAVEFVPPRVDAGDEPFTSIKGLEGTVVLTKTGTNDGGLATATFPDGFTFPYFGARFGDAQVAMDGYVCFGGTTECNTTSTHTNQNVPSSTKPNNLIAAFWDDLEWVDNQTSFLMRLEGEAPARRLTLEWNEIDFYSSSEDGAKLTFQVVLFEDGYWEVRNAPRVRPDKNVAANARWGSSATIGAEGPGGAAGALFSYNKAGALCSSYTAGSGTTFGSCTPVTRVSPLRLPTSGAVEMLVTGDDILKMRAVGPLGEATSSSLVVKAFEPAEARELSASRVRVAQGESVTLTWSAGPNTTVVRSLGITGPEGAVEGVAGLSGTVDVTPAQTSTYTLVVGNEIGDTATKSVEVVVGAPVATLVADRTELPVGETVDLSWTSEGARTLRLVDPAGADLMTPLAYANAADRTKLRAGTQRVTPTVSGPYRLLVENASGEASAEQVLDVVTELRLLSFGASLERQTADEPVSLSWETYNATRVTIASSATGEVVFDSSTAATVRKSSFGGVMGSADTSFTLTVHGAGGEPISRTVTVVVVPKAAVTLTALPPSIPWSGSTTLRWTSTDATQVRLVQLVSSGATVSEGPAVPGADGRLSGEVSLQLFRTTSYRVVATNELGHSKFADVTVSVNVQAATMQVTVTPDAALIRGGHAKVDWTSSQGESVYFWKKGADALQVPYEYVPGGFDDVSGIGTELVLQTTAGVENYDTGSAVVTFPAGFEPKHFGVAMRGLRVSADGLVVLTPTPSDTSATSIPGCASGCGSNATTFPTTTDPDGYLAPFWDDLEGCPGATTRAECPETRPGGPGRVHWAMRGTAPHRMAVVQWTNFDFSADNASGAALTFQVKVFENGDAEYQYKTLVGPNKAWSAGSSATVAAESFDGAHAFAVRSNAPFLSSGDGYRLYVGERPASGSLRSLVSPSAGADIAFRGTAVNAVGEVVDQKKLPVRHGAGELIISELMLDPVDGDDANREWIEIRNTSTIAANLRGYTLQTSSGSFTFAADLNVPAHTSAGGNGLVVIAQSANTSLNGGVPAAFGYGNGVTMDDVADSVILRYGDTLIDRVEYDLTAGWQATPGRALALDPNAATPGSGNLPALWCPSRDPNDPSARATPGNRNAVCHQFVPTTYDPTTRLADAGLTPLIVGTTPSVVLAVPIGFPFPYYGSERDVVSVAAYGYLGLGGHHSTSGNSSNAALPATTLTSGAYDGIYPFWDTLSPVSQAPVGAVYAQTQGEAPNRRFVVNWSGLDHSSEAAARFDFSVVLEESGGVSFHYHSMTGSYGDGRSATIGLEAYGDTYGVTYSHLTGSTTSPAGPLAGVVPTALHLERVR